MVDSDLPNSARPSTIEAIMRYSGGAFRSKQLSTRREHKSVGELLQSLSEEGHLQKVVESQVTKYKLSEELRAELEDPHQGQETLGGLMREAKSKWRGLYEDKIDGYNLEELKEDIPQALYIGESNSKRKKLFEIKDHRLNSETLDYLEEIGMIDDIDERNIMLDDLEIEMVKNYFSKLE